MRSIIAGLVLVLATVGGAEAQIQSHLLIVSGLGGEPKYVDDFLAWGSGMAEAAQNRFGVPAENIVYLSEEPARKPAVVDGEATKARIESALRAMASKAAANDRILILLIGHGSSDGRGSRINLPGPDLTAAELNGYLSAFPTQPVVVVVAASASGDWQDAVAGPNRAIITATRSPMERNESIFGRFFVEAYRAEGADSDRDGRVTLQEAYTFANRETERSYQTAGTLQMEHARMEGNLQVAETFHLGAPSGAIPANASPALRALYERRRAIEDTVDALRNRRGQMEAAAYEAELERVLLELAQTNRSIRESEAAPR